MKAKALLIIGSIILILGGGFLATMGFALEYMTLVYYGGTLLFVGIVGAGGVLFAKKNKAGYFFIIMGVAIWLPVVLAVMLIGDVGGNTETAALGLGLPAFIVTVLWCAGGTKNING